MIIDLVKELKLKEITTTFTGIEINYYATYNDRCLVVGHPIIYNVYTKEKIVSKERYLFAVEFDINNDNFDDVQEIIQEYKKNRIIYQASWSDKEQQFLYQLNENGYCFVYSPIVIVDCIENIRYEINRKKNYCNIINVDGFKDVLLNLEKKFTWQYESNYEINPNDINKALSFIKDLDFLLLSDDEELRNIFINYKKSISSYTASELSYKK